MNYNIELLEEFRSQISHEINNLFIKAKEADETSYVFSLLGISNGIENSGWDTVIESDAFVCDFIGLIGAPLNLYTRIRIMLQLYCHIIEMSHFFHVLYNMFLTIQRKEPPNIFNFLDKYTGDKPPSSRSKLFEIKKKAKFLGFHTLETLLNEIYKFNIRNAVLHSDYTIWEDEIRLKHKTVEIKKIKFTEFNTIFNKAIIYFEEFFKILKKHKFSYKNGYIITDRKSSNGKDLSDIELIVNNELLVGFKSKGLLPVWE